VVPITSFFLEKTVIFRSGNGSGQAESSTWQVMKKLCQQFAIGGLRA
jgi:hypothetical protein